MSGSGECESSITARGDHEMGIRAVLFEDLVDKVSFAAMLEVLSRLERLLISSRKCTIGESQWRSIYEAGRLYGRKIHGLPV